MANFESKLAKTRGKQNKLEKIRENKIRENKIRENKIKGETIRGKQNQNKNELHAMHTSMYEPLYLLLCS